MTWRRGLLRQPPLTVRDPGKYADAWGSTHIRWNINVVLQDSRATPTLAVHCASPRMPTTSPAAEPSPPAIRRWPAGDASPGSELDPVLGRPPAAATAGRSGNRSRAQPSELAHHGEQPSTRDYFDIPNRDGAEMTAAFPLPACAPRQGFRTCSLVTHRGLVARVPFSSSRGRKLAKERSSACCPCLPTSAPAKARPRCC